MNRLSLSQAFKTINPANTHLRIATIIPLTQKTLKDVIDKEAHLIEFPDIHPHNYIYDSFIGGDVVLGKENGIENTILIGNGQPIEFGRFNSLQNLEAHGSDIREVGVHWGDGNFIAHRAIFHGCTGGDQNYLGVGTIIPDLADAGSKNYFLHGTTVGAGMSLSDYSGYRGHYIDNSTTARYGDSENVMYFENQRTLEKTYLGELFHDDMFRFMRETIVPRTKHLLAHLSLQKGGYDTGHIGKRPALGVMIHHVLQTSEYYYGFIAKSIAPFDTALAKRITQLQKIYTLFLEGSSSIGMTPQQIHLEGEADIETDTLIESWKQRKATTNEAFASIKLLIQTLQSDKIPSEYESNIIILAPQPDRRNKSFTKTQNVLVVDTYLPQVPALLVPAYQLKRAIRKIKECTDVLESQLTKQTYSLG